MDNFDLRKYLAEDRLYENALAQKLRDEAKQPDSKVGASIFNKYAKKIENADKADYKKIIKAMESELISKHPNTFSGEDDIPGSFLSEDKLNEAFNELDDGFDKELEFVIKGGYKLYPSRLEDVIYYIHNNWMAGNYGDDYAMGRINKFLTNR